MGEAGGGDCLCFEYGVGLPHPHMIQGGGGVLHFGEEHWGRPRGGTGLAKIWLVAFGEGERSDTRIGYQTWLHVMTTNSFGELLGHLLTHSKVAKSSLTRLIGNVVSYGFVLRFNFLFLFVLHWFTHLFIGPRRDGLRGR